MTWTGFRVIPAKLGVGLTARGNGAVKTKTPAAGAGAFQADRWQRLARCAAFQATRVDIGAADADVGKLAVAQAGQFAQALVVTLPLRGSGGQGWQT